jgi:RimJ/RimL family protein N-acetyltransferase
MLHPNHLTSMPIPFAIRVDTEHYLVRSLDVADATERAGQWLADPQKAKMINAPARALSLTEMRDYIAGHDRIAGHILGIFDKANGNHIGFWAVYVDWSLQEFLANVLVGERGSAAPGARRATQRPVMAYFFEDLGLETLRFSVLSRNENVGDKIERAGLAPEHMSFTASVEGQAALEEVQHYRVSKEVWRSYADYREP